MLNKPKNNKEILYSSLLIIIPVTLLFVAVFISKPDIDTFIEASQNTDKLSNEQHTLDVFGDIRLKAKAAIVKDLNTEKILYAKNIDTPLPLASITKILTALTAHINSEANIVGISTQALNTEGNSGLFPGEQFYKKDLVNLTLISSSNDGATALALNTFTVSENPEKDFVTEMNRVAREIGMKNSFFYNETGLDNNSYTAGAHGSASDIATLLEYVLINYPEIIEFTKEDLLYIKSLNGFVHPAKNTNNIVGKLPNILASKTGYTEIAGGNLAVVIDPVLNSPVAIVVLGSTEEGRFEDVAKLADKVTEYFRVNYNSDL